MRRPAGLRDAPGLSHRAAGRGPVPAERGQLLRGAGAGITLPGPLVETERQNLDDAFSRLSADALQSIRQVLTLPVLWIYGGRFSYSLAYYLHAHLHLLRPRVSLLNTSSVPIAEEIVEVGRGHGLVIFDFREYELEALFAARYARGRRSQVLLVTDPELSPVARYANHVLPIPVNKPLPSFTAVTAAVDAIVLDLIQHHPGTVTQQSERIAESRQLLRQLRADETQAERRRDPEHLPPRAGHTPSAIQASAGQPLPGHGQRGGGRVGAGALRGVKQLPQGALGVPAGFNYCAVGLSWDVMLDRWSIRHDRRLCLHA